MIYGNKEGIRDSMLAKLETLYDIEIPTEVFAPAELLDALAAFSCAINREISMYISRSGEVLDITIGGISSVDLKDMHLRRNTKRLSMVRCIHTHPGGNPQLSDVDISSLRAMRFDAMAAVGAKDGYATGIQSAFLGPYVGGVNQVHLTNIVSIHKLPHALVDAFHSTLEEALLADVLLIVSDGASGEMIRQHDVVLEVLSSLGAADKPMIDVINKADLPGVTANEWPGAIAISAKKGEGLDALLEAIRLKLRGAARPMHAVIPYAQGGLLAKIHADGQVLGEEYTAEGIDVTALADEQLFGRLAAQLGEQAVTWQD